MSAKANYFKIGLFVIAGAALGTAAVVILGAGAIFREVEMAETYIDESVQGLEIGAAVRLRGVKVGTVKEITFVRNEYPEAADPENEIPYVLVRFTLHPDKFRGKSKVSMGPILQRRIKEDGLRCKLAPQGLTGLLYLEIDLVPDFADYPSLDTSSWTPDPAYHYIPSHPSLITRISEAMEILMDQLGQVLGQVGTALEQLGPVLTQLEPSLNDLNILIQKLSSQVGDAKVSEISDKILVLIANLDKSSQSFQDFMNKPEFDEILRNASRTMESAAGTVEASEEIVKRVRGKTEELLDGLLAASKKVNEASDQIHELLAGKDLPEAAAHLNNALRRLDKMISQQQMNIESILDNIQQVSENLKDITREAKDNPSGVLIGSPPPPVKLEK